MQRAIACNRAPHDAIRLIRQLSARGARPFSSIELRMILNYTLRSFSRPFPFNPPAP
ncbi:hypothetical protein C7S17_5341 [Burkholderia thailandensis]|nr:hypothetical protein [Burkholderia thailandensis]